MAHRSRLLATLKRTRSALAAVLVAFVLLAPAASPVVAQVRLANASEARAVIPISAAGCTTGYIYAAQSTGSSTVIDHNACSWPKQPYQGWIGIDGQITTPSTVVQLDSGDHAAGWLGMTEYDTAGVSNDWIQIGWFIGGGSDCPQDLSGYELYIEYTTSGPSGAQCFKLSNLSPGSSVTYRIEYDANGCWDAFYNYNVEAAAVCGLPHSMAAQATNELYNGNSFGRDQTMPQSVFGSSDPNTNAALRIRGASGWEPWSNTIDGGTLQVDERLNCPPCYYISSYQVYYHELTYGG